jgi:hypothetical protein
MSGSAKHDRKVSWQLSALLFVILAAGPAFSQEYLDGDNEPATQRNGLHACRLGDFVRGLDADRNILLCGPPPRKGSAIGTEFIDGNNEPPHQITIQGSTMHACPHGRALTGINIRRNEFLCRDYIPDTLPLTRSSL